MSPLKLKLDLHTHIFEQYQLSSPGEVTPEMVEKIIERALLAGLDGIAITEHGSKNYGYRVMEIMDTHFNGEIFVIPGREFDTGRIHYVELDIPGKDILPFRFIAHPGYPGKAADNAQGFNGIEIENAAHNWHIKRGEVEKIAEEHNLVLLSNSDAHLMKDIGKCYTEISLEDLCKVGPV